MSPAFHASKVAFTISTFCSEIRPHPVLSCDIAREYPAGEARRRSHAIF